MVEDMAGDEGLFGKGKLAEGVGMGKEDPGRSRERDSGKI